MSGQVRGGEDASGQRHDAIVHRRTGPRVVLPYCRPVPPSMRAWSSRKRRCARHRVVTASAQFWLTSGRPNISQSTHSDPGRPCTRVIRAESSEELLHRQAATVAARPQLGEAGARRPARSRRPPSANRSGPDSNTSSASWDQHALGPVPRRVLVGNEAAPQLLRIGIELDVRVRCAVIKYVVKVLHDSPYRALRADGAHAS